VTAFDRINADHCRFFSSSTSVQVLYEAMYTFMNTTHGVLMQGSASCGGVGVFYAPEESDMPPGFGNRAGVGAPNAPGDPDLPPGFGHCGGVGVPNAPGDPDLPPGFGRSLPASTGKSRGPKRILNLEEAFGDK